MVEKTIANSASTFSSSKVMFTRESQPSTSSESSQPCRHFEFPDILSATNNFDESLVIGHGGFGKVYKGNITSGSSIGLAAIKRLDSMSSQGAAEFWAEVKMLSMLRHCNLVSLLGYCIYEKEKILVYEYMPNGTLEDHLHKLGTTLSWLQRLKVCIGAARGLDYLHTGTGIELGVIHRDVKTSNILLLKSWAAKISDFGLSKIGPTNQPSTYVNTLDKGTFGYFDPHYFATGRLSRKSDVYAFGVVLLEVLCRKHPLDKSLEEGLATWAQDSIKEGNLKHIIDSDIRIQISPKCLKEFVRIAERCLLSNPKQRPTMAEVVVILDSILTLQEKTSSSLQAAGGTIFGKMLDMLSLPSIGENSGHGGPKVSSNSKAKSRNTDEDYRIPLPRLKAFKFTALESATKNFSQDLLLGRGSCGEVFLGWVDKDTFAASTEGVGIAVAVKRYNEGDREWRTVVTVLGRLAHPNIVSLLGFCKDKENKCLLVYEYMENRNLGHFLFGDAPNVTQTLAWGTRLTIMIGVARGLHYMHLSGVIHGFVKSCNILLDEDFNAKLGDFEWARVCRQIESIHETTRIMPILAHDPWSQEAGTLTVKSDVHSFGMILLETLTGQRAWDSKFPIPEFDLVEWASPFLADRIELKRIMDPRLEQNYPLKGAFQCAALTSRCLALHHKDKPSIREVLLSLEQIYAANK